VTVLDRLLRFQVVSLTPPDSASSELLHRELPWFGPVSDALLTPPPGGLFGSPASAAIVLSSPGQLHLYDEPSISEALTPGASEDAHPPLPQPLPLLEQQTPITVSETVTGTAAATGLCTLLQLPRDAAGGRLPSGGKWPVEGGAFGSPPPQEEELFTVIVTGHESGKVVLWDACSPMLRKVCTVLGKGKVRMTGRFDFEKRG
jgi:syntaxin-binding protein 5